MAVKGTLARILVDEVDLSCETSAVVMSNSISEDDCTTLCSTAAEYTPILASISINQDGYMATVNEAGSLEEELYTRMGVMGSTVCALFGIDVPACPAYVIDNTFGATMEIAAPANGVITLNGSWGQGKGGHRGVRILDANVTATGNQTAVDLVDPGTLGGSAFLFVQDKTGTLTSATVTVSSATTQGGTYTVLGTFTVTALGSYTVTFSGNVSRWLRVGVTSMGGTTGLDMVCVVCVRGVTE
jgi:hypothetical protein